MIHAWAWYIGISALVIFSSLKLFKNLFHQVVFVSLSVIPMCFIFNPISPYADYGNGMAGLLESKVSQTYLGFLFLILFFKNLSYVHLQKLTHAVCIFAVLDAVYCLFNYFYFGSLRGVMDTSDPIFLALVFPLVGFVERKKLWMQFVPALILISVIVISQSVTAIWILTFHILFFAFLKAHNFVKVISLLGVMIFSVLLTALFLFNPNLFADHGRYQIWQAALNYFIENVNWFWGAGLGTFELFGPHIQIQNELTHLGYFTWMHNDWLQILFECGAIGLLSTLSLWCMTIARSIHRPYLACSVIGYGLCMITQMPLHLFPTFFLGGLFMALVYKKEIENV